MEIMNEDTNFLQMIIKIFPWIYDIHREFLRSFPGDYEEHSLNQLNKKILEELQEISSCCTSERTKYLFETLGYFYKHFCWKVKWNMSSQFMQATCVRLLSNLIKVGAFLIQGNVESPWLNRILAAIKVFPGPNDHLFNAILYVNILKKKHLNVYRVILRTVLCSNYLTVKEPIEYLKVIVLFRRLKSLIKDPIWNIEINSAFARIKAPKSLKSWLLAHNFKVFCNVEQKIIIKKLMNKSLDKVLFRRLLEIILPEINLKKSSSKNKNKMNFGGSDKFTIDNTGLAQTEPEMILSVNSESSEFIPPIVKKTKKKRKLNISLGQENAMTKSTNVGKEISVLNDLAEKKSRKKKTKLLNENSSKNMNCSCSDLLVIDNTGLLQAESETILSDNNESSEIIPCILKKTKKRKLNIAFGQENAMIKSTNVENELSMSYDHAKKERRKKTKKISLHGVDNIQTQNDVTLCDIQDNSLTSSIVKIDCSKPETKLFVEMTNKEKLTEITSKQIYSNDVLSLSDSDDCKIIYTSHSSDHEGHSSENKTSKIKSPSICILNKNHSIVVNESKTTEDISNMEREMSYKKEETIIGIEIKTSDDISLSNLHDINNDLVGQELCVPGEKEHVSDTRKQIKDSNNYESLLETTLQESSPEQMQITTKSADLVEIENCSPTVNEKEFKSVLDGGVNELSDSLDNSNLQKGTKDEFTDKHDRKNKEVVINIPESIELCHKHTIPVLAESHKKPLLNDDIGNKLISAKSSKNIMGIKSDNCSIEIIESGHNIVESNSDQVIEDYALKNVSLSSDLIIVENSCENQIKSIEQSTKDMSSVEIRTETHPSVTVGYIMEKMLNHLERAEHAVEDCSFESSKHNIFKSSIKITPDISFSSSVIKDSNSESSLLKKDRNHLSFLDFSSGKSKSPNKPENIENLASKVSEFYIYRDMVRDIDDNKSEDTLSESQITDKVDTNECLSNYCSYNSSDSELDKSDDNCNSSISLADDVCIDYNSCDSPDKFCVKNNIPDPFEHGFISSIKRKVDVENETNTKIQGICISGKNDNNGIEEYSPASKEISTMKSVKCILKKLSPVVHMGEKCDLKDLSENNYKMLKNCSDSAPEFNFKSENDNKLCDLENPIPQENQIEDYDQYIKKVENNPKMPWIVLRDICHVEEPFSPKTDTSKSLLHHINNQIKSNLSNKEINSSTNSDNIKDQIDSYSTELNGHNIIEPSLGMKLRERTYQTTFVKKSASILEEALTESSIEKETKTPVKLACRMSLRNRNATSSCTSSGIKQNEKRMQKKEINQSLGLEFSELSLDSPKSKRKIFNESSVKNTSEELKDPVVIDSEIQSQSAVLNREMEVCRRSIRTSTAVSMKVDNSQNTSNQEIDSGGYHLRSRKSIVMPGKLKL
ncbi:uncharacterized protein NPIL_370671 [Nephila pilipes]|uniref:Uncharacterized protein n=1 Tax=Nephila pilipes TaxID=299642 RepID=A0A8X6U621_NEPPI|nr:uncharacterized protein NPIL_370671 [Nephila pilipes]